MTALHYAADKGHLEIVKMMLQCERLDVNTKGNVRRQLL
jgi:ankyrin repeat protein